MQITLTFTEQLNSSLQIGDTAWYVNTGQAGGYDTAKSSFARKLGVVKDIINQNENNKIIVSNNFSNESLTLNSDVFIMFSKDNRANTSSLVGYYAEVSLENNSKNKVELFAVGSEVSQSSK